MIEVKIGDIFKSKATTLVNTVNCVGVMGKGIAEVFKKKFPGMFNDYLRRCKDKLVKPGHPYYYTDLTGTSIINFPTKDHWRSPSKLSYIIEGLDWFIQNYEDLGITSIAFPPLGCGNGGLKWEDVGPLMYGKLRDLPIDIELFAPYGTNLDLINKEYLSKEAKANIDLKGKLNSSANPNWLLIPYIIQYLSQYKYTCPVGRTIFQKICFVLTHTGVDTGMVFFKASYGPFSKEAKDVMSYLYNTNLVHEDHIGNMVAVHASNAFSLDMAQYPDDILKKVRKTIDLFLRVKNTNHAEMLTTVLFAYDQLKASNNRVSEMDVLGYVLHWKPHWKETRERDIAIAVRDLAVLGWLKVSFSRDLPYQECVI